VEGGEAVNALSWTKLRLCAFLVALATAAHARGPTLLDLGEVTAGIEAVREPRWVPDSAVRDDLVRRGMAAHLWEPHDPHSRTRRHLINARAKLIALGWWDEVTFISTCAIESDQRLQLHRADAWGIALQPAAVLHRRLSTRSLLCAIAGAASVQAFLGPGFFPQPNGHPEGRWQFKEFGKPHQRTDIVSHFIGLKRAPYVTLHFDSGYGLPVPAHLSHHPDAEEITRGLLADPAARPHLRGISPELDARIDANAP
jgi:hypothetical protein